MSGLTEQQLAKLPRTARDKLLFDGAGLFLRLRGDRATWQYRYFDEGKRRFTTLGHYPRVPLHEARELAKACAEKREGGADVKRVVELVRIDRRLQAQRDFESIARRWHTNMAKDRKWSKGYAHKVIRHLEIHLFPWLGKLEIDSIHPTELVRCLHRIKDRGTLETAQRVREAVQQVFSYAVDTGVLDATKNFVTSRTGALPSPRAKHYAAILEPKVLGELLRNIDLYNGNIITKVALQLAPMLFQRPGQLRTADWSEIDLEGAIWTCPAKKMKMREWQKRDPNARPHKVPLPTQAVALLHDLHDLTGPHGAVFKSVSRRSEPSRYLSENTLNAALRALGYDTRSEITTHGFRATARTLIRQQLKWPEDVIERHLAHVSTEELGGAYDRADFLEERRRMVQQWADYLDTLKGGERQPARPLSRVPVSAAHRAKQSPAQNVQYTPIVPGEWRD